MKNHYVMDEWSVTRFRDTFEQCVAWAEKLNVQWKSAGSPARIYRIFYDTATEPRAIVGAPEECPATATCLAVLDDLIESMTSAPAPGSVIARWENSGAEIIIDGVFSSKGNWGAQGIRWHCPKLGNKGLFGRGIALYGNRLPLWADQLPRVR